PDMTRRPAGTGTTPHGGDRAERVDAVQFSENQITVIAIEATCHGNDHYRDRTGEAAVRRLEPGQISRRAVRRPTQRGNDRHHRAGEGPTGHDRARVDCSRRRSSIPWRWLR